MLTLFLLIGTAFIVSSNQYRKSEKSLAKFGEQENLRASQEGFLGEVISQLIRDTDNQNSALRFHSLLRDLYGADGIIIPNKLNANSADPLANNRNFNFAGMNDIASGVSGPGNVTNGQFLEFTLANNYEDLLGNPWSDISGQTNYKPFSPLSNYYQGQLLTFLNGPAQGHTTRIVGYVPETRTVRILNFPAENGQAITSPAFLTNLAGSKILINGRPFNGTGVGYNPNITSANAPKLSGLERVTTSSGNQDLPIALMPNAAFFNPDAVDDFSTPVTAGYFDPRTNPAHPLYNPQAKRLFEGQGGSDESYDAPDFQNMFLAWTGPNVVDTIFTSLDGTTINGTTYNRTNPPPFLGGVVLPSFHRPDLLNYWANQTKSGSDYTLGRDTAVPLLRKIMLRPNWHDHPNFTGSNPEFSQALATAKANSTPDHLYRMIYGPWDVDNDNDGVRDSVWVDFGAPVIMDQKGRLVKPLAAIMIVDMDGRLNVNAHGTRELAGIGELQEPNAPVPGYPLPAGTATGIAPQTAWNNFPRGQSFGVAEISLKPVVGDSAFQRLLNVRYGGNNEEPGSKDRYDLSAQLKMQGFPNNAVDGSGNYTNFMLRSDFGSLSDLRSRYKTALNDFGQFVTTWTPLDSQAHPLTEDSPYELDLSATGPRGTGTAADSPFSLTELERVLRAYDIDAGTLPARLFNALNASSNLGVSRTLLTTDSYDLPEPGFQLPEWVRNGPDGIAGNADDYATLMGRLPVNATFADLVEYRIRLANGWTAPASGTPDPNLAAIQRFIKNLVAPEMLAGKRLDLNRPFGNGRDDNNNGVVDEPGEVEGPFWWLEDSRLSANEAANTTKDAFRNTYGYFRDDIDRNGDGSIEPWERGYTEGNVVDRSSASDPLTHNELVNLHNFRRQLFARHLYVLAMAVIDPLAVPTGGPTDATYLLKLRDRARDLAQWAINAADFRDPDNIMTVFEYSENPFLSGWFVDPTVATPVLIDGLINTTNPPYPTANHVQMVWGTERPEVLMTETLAWHDRWTEDGPGENPDSDEIDSGKKGSTDYDADKYDRSFDQRQRPRGAAFVELYNPAAPMPGASADTHYLDASGNDLGINLAAVSQYPRTNINSPQATDFSPVWRLAVYQTRQVRGDSRNVIAGPDKDPDDRNSDNIPSTIDRSVYFTGFDPATNTNYYFDTASAKRAQGVGFYNRIANLNAPNLATDNVVPPLRPGRYMVVGGGVETSAGSGQYLASFGAKTGSRSSTRGVVLNTRRSSEAARGVELRGAGDPTDPNSIVMDQAGFMVQSLSEAQAIAAGLPVIAGDTSVSTADVALIDRATNPRTGQPHTSPRPFNITEPAGGYPDRWAGSQWDGTQYGTSYIDIPLDDQRSIAAAGGGIGGGGGGGGGIGGGGGNSSRKPTTDPLVDGEYRLSLPGQAGGGGIGGGGGNATGNPEQARRIVPGFSWIYLQRLANPLLAWNPLPTLPNGAPNPDFRVNLPVNPYLTVDSMGANVTVFNGLSKSENLRTSGDANPLEFRNQRAVDTFASVQRGRVNVPTDPALKLSELQQRAARTGGRSMQPIDPNTAQPASQPVANLWNTEGIGITGSRVAGYFRNRAGTGSGAEPNANDPAKDHHFNGIPDNTLGFLNEPFRNLGVAADPVRARIVPQQPFPALQFLNRPFANPGEITQVPHRRASQLLQTFSFVNPVTTDVKVPKQELYVDANAGARAFEVKLSDKLKWLVDGPYGHLLNFFRINTKGQDQRSPNDDEGIAGLYRVLDLVSVPSLYVGEETWLSPVAFGNPLSDSTAVPDVKEPRDPRYGFQPPFNRVSSRREPGRVNINTIGAESVWNALFHGDVRPNPNNDTHPGPSDNHLSSTRRGYGNDKDPTLLNPNFPSVFANPVRSSGAADLVPLTSMLRKDKNGANFDADVTLFRADTNTPDNPPLGLPFSAALTNQPFRDSNRNAQFRYAPISRLSSLTTNRSNVFAVWVTIGFFEVEEVPAWTGTSDQVARFGTQAVYNRVYPDGYTFGKEAGIDTGETIRYREFAIIDRTIPVGFEPGANHNARETIRLQRKIIE